MMLTLTTPNVSFEFLYFILWELTPAMSFISGDISLRFKKLAHDDQIKDNR